MKALLLKFAGLIPGKLRKKATPISIVKMHALRLLEVYLEQRCGLRIILTQADVVATDIIKEDGGSNKAHCSVFIEAFFYFEGMGKLHGRVGRAPIPPKVLAKVSFGAENADIPRWIISEVVDATFENAGSIMKEVLDVMRMWERLLDASREFDFQRPIGLLAHPDNHDEVAWQVNPGD